jgi:hypothetical protein
MTLLRHAVSFDFLAFSLFPGAAKRAKYYYPLYLFTPVLFSCFPAFPSAAKRTKYHHPLMTLLRHPVSLDFLAFQSFPVPRNVPNIIIP